MTDASGTPIGTIVQENLLGKPRFSYLVDGRRVGGIRAENWRAWNFTLLDDTDTEIGSITKTWEGLRKAAFTTADNYVVRIHRPLHNPLAALTIASALTVDSVLKQNQTG